MQFADYPLLFITGKSSPLRAIGEKLGAKIILHPEIGGRYTGLTEVALAPSAICGFDVKALHNGAKKFYDLYQKDNLAWRAAVGFIPVGTKRLRGRFYAFLHAQFISNERHCCSALPRKFRQGRKRPNLFCPRGAGIPAPHQPKIFWRT